MPALPTDLLARPAAQSVRLIARSHLDAATEASARLDDPKDLEALHDFRVAIRRLRSTIRAYRPELQGSIRPKLRRGLRDITDESNRVREAEVALDWLRGLKPDLTARERVGLRWLVQRVEDRRASGLEHVRSDVRRSFRAAGRRLRKGLAVYRQVMDPDQPETVESFASVARRALLEQAQQLDQLLGSVHAPDDEEAHRARIAAKRLRYLLEPLVQALPASTGLVARLKELQDRLGELHDVLELEHEVRAAVEAAAAERAGRLFDVALMDHATTEQLRAARRRDPRPGLVAVARRLRPRLATVFASLQSSGLGSDAAWLREITTATAPLTAVSVGASRPLQRVQVPVPVPPARRHVRRER
jgi:CHAD domain-containing protein